MPAVISVLGAIGLAVFTGVMLRRKGVGAEPVADEGAGERAEPEPSRVA